MAKPPLIFSRPGGSYYRVLLNVTQLGAAPVDLTVWSALDPHTSTSVLASLSTVFTRSLLSGRFLQFQNAIGLRKRNLYLLLWLPVTR